jgi:TIR domain
MTKSFDVFLSHNSKDRAAVRELAEALRARGLKVWLDEWELIPGRPWQEALEEVIETIGASVMLVGKDGLGPWQNREMRSCLNEFVRRQLPVIPVLLPHAPEEPKLPIFLNEFTWVDLRSGLTEEGLDQLQWGITGNRLDRPKLESIPATAPELPVAAAKEQSGQKTRTRRGVTVWIGLLMLLGIAVFLGTYYSSKSAKPGAGDQQRVTPGTDTPAPAAPAPAPVDTFPRGHPLYELFAARFPIGREAFRTPRDFNRDNTCHRRQTEVLTPTRLDLVPGYRSVRYEYRLDVTSRLYKCGDDWKFSPDFTVSGSVSINLAVEHSPSGQAIVRILSMEEIQEDKNKYPTINFGAAPLMAAIKAMDGSVINWPVP